MHKGSSDDELDRGEELKFDEELLIRVLLETKDVDACAEFGNVNKVTEA